MSKIKIDKERRMTLDEHREIGKFLQDTRNMLVVNGVDLDIIYGKTKELGMKLEIAAKFIDEVRSQLDDRLFNENPDLKSEEGCKYYY